MTHPDIIKMERCGIIGRSSVPCLIGECRYCGTELYDDMPELVKSDDGWFCEIECCHEYYQIRSL